MKLLAAWLNRSHLWMAFGGACMAAECLLVAGLPFDTLYLAFAAAVTWLGYFFLKWNEWRYARQWMVIALTLVFLGFPRYFHPTFALALALVAGYDLSWIRRFRNRTVGLRYYWPLKPLVITACWMMPAFWWPLALLRDYPGERVYFGLSSAAFILALALCGDLRDASVDAGQCRSPVQVLGKNTVLTLVVVLLCVSFVLLAMATGQPERAWAGPAFSLGVVGILNRIPDWQLQTFLLDAMLPLRWLVSAGCWIELTPLR